MNFRPFVIVTALVLTGCDSNPAEIDDTGDPGMGTVAQLNLPDEPFRYALASIPTFALPQTSDEDNTPANNLVTDEGATLGRVLFYETQLSANGTVACASCHEQAAGFADPDAFSEGFDGAFTDRNAMSVANVRFYRNGRMFWDERAESVEEQALQPIQNEVEMGLTLEEAVSRIESQPYYAELFEAAFGTAEVTSERIARAIAQFERSMVTFNSKYDVARDGMLNPPGQDLPGFTAQENQGLRLFFSQRTQCSRCHRGDLFVGDQARNNGLDASTTRDQGAGNGRFKAPSLRNIQMTAPYMHDGRLDDLRDVVEHYNRRLANHPNLDNRLEQNGAPIRMNLSGEEMDALVAFMNTLTDPTLATDERFSDPFVGR